MDKSEQNRIKKRIGIALRRFLLGTSPSHKYELTFGCDREFFRAFIEHQFQEWMSWDNFTERWQIGHVVPLCAFDHADQADIRLCWNWVNIRPVYLGCKFVSYERACEILGWREQHFKNPILDALIERAVSKRWAEEAELVDWTTFKARNSYHVVWEGENDGHECDNPGGCSSHPE